MTYFNEDQQKLAESILNRMLRTSLWGVLDITFMQKRYEILEVALIIKENELFKEQGFTVDILDGGNFIQKVPFFYGNEEFIQKNNLYFLGKPSYNEYLYFMYNNLK